MRRLVKRGLRPGRRAPKTTSGCPATSILLAQRQASVGTSRLLTGNGGERGAYGGQSECRVIP